MKRNYSKFIVLTTGVLLLSGFALQNEDLLYNTSRAIDLFSAVFRQVTKNYVDPVDPVEVTNAAIKGMLSTLDPYTQFVEDSKKSELDLLTSGSYGGVGINIVLKNRRYIVSGIHEEVRSITPLRIGDIILEIDNTSLTEGTEHNLKQYLRGLPGTHVKLTVARPAFSGSIEFTLLRRQIPVASISHAEILDGNIGYVKVSRFTRRAGEEVRSELKQMIAKRNISGLILDLRNNPGGLLEAAVDIVEKFVPRGSPIVSTRGRHPNFSRRYFSTEDPLTPSIPLVVLVNSNSASASEIVAGAIQDLDRGIILGTRTFGKGLVQSVVPLNYNASLKMTTSKYYIPSGRCIQKLKYGHGNSAPAVSLVNGDTARVFHTLQLQRPVLEAGGIMPDVETVSDTSLPYLRRLRNNGSFMQFVSYHRNSVQQEGMPVIDDDLLKEFRTYIDSTLPPQSNEVLLHYSALLALARDNGFGENAIADIETVGPVLKNACADLFRMHRSLIERTLKQEFTIQIEGKSAGIHQFLPDDPQVRKALDLLGNSDEYQLVLGIGS